MTQITLVAAVSLVLPALPRAGGVILAGLPGCSEWLYPDDEEDPLRVVYSLAGEAHLVVETRDAAGNSQGERVIMAADGLVVSLESDIDNFPEKTATTSGGRYQFSDLASGEFRATVDSPIFGRQSSEWIDLWVRHRSAEFEPFSVSTGGPIHAYPNPSTGQATIVIHLVAEAQGTVTIRDFESIGLVLGTLFDGV